MKPLAELPRQGIRGLLFDIDETLTTEGRLTASAYGALERLKLAGRTTVAVTGRPAGWCDHIARMWPVDAVVGENGAFWFRHDRAAGRLMKRYVVSDEERALRRARLGAIAERVLAEVPGCAVASDQPYREADLAIDFREDVPPLPMGQVQRIVEIMESEGLTAKASSIHVNGWFGGYDKLSTTRLMLREEFAIDVDASRAQFVFAGDSPNDQPMFRFFPNAVGVANVRDMEELMRDLPAWITPSPGSNGFAELADALLAARGARP